MEEKNDPLGVTAEDLKALKASVKRRSAHHLGKHDVEDIMSEVCLAAAVTVSKAGSTAPFIKVAHVYARKASYYQRGSLDAVRRRAEMAISNAEGGSPLADVPDPRSDATSVAVRDVLTRLPRHYAQVLFLCDMENYTLQQASRVLRVPVPTLHRRRALARAAFAKAWTDED